MISNGVLPINVLLAVGLCLTWFYFVQFQMAVPQVTFHPPHPPYYTTRQQQQPKNPSYIYESKQSKVCSSKCRHMTYFHCGSTKYWHIFIQPVSKQYWKFVICDSPQLNCPWIYESICNNIVHNRHGIISRFPKKSRPPSKRGLKVDARLFRPLNGLRSQLSQFMEIQS